MVLLHAPCSWRINRRCPVQRSDVCQRAVFASMRDMRCECVWSGCVSSLRTRVGAAEELDAVQPPRRRLKPSRMLRVQPHDFKSWTRLVGHFCCAPSTDGAREERLAKSCSSQPSLVAPYKIAAPPSHIPPPYSVDQRSPHAACRTPPRAVGHSDRHTPRASTARVPSRSMHARRPTRLDALCTDTIRVAKDYSWHGSIGNHIPATCTNTLDQSSGNCRCHINYLPDSPRLASTYIIARTVWSRTRAAWRTHRTRHGQHTRHTRTAHVTRNTSSNHAASGRPGRRASVAHRVRVGLPFFWPANSSTR